VQIEADVVRLALGDGSPLDTFRTELRSYDLHHHDATLFRRLLKCVSIMPALFLSARNYKALKQSLDSNPFYQKVREKVFPYHRSNHVDRTGDWNL
jgi:hypothetical protein